MSKSLPPENNCVHNYFFLIKSEMFYMYHATLSVTDRDKLTAMTFSVSWVFLPK